VYEPPRRHVSLWVIRYSRSSKATDSLPLPPSYTHHFLTAQTISTAKPPHFDHPSWACSSTATFKCRTHQLSDNTLVNRLHTQYLGKASLEGCRGRRQHFDNWGKRPCSFLAQGCRSRPSERDKQKPASPVGLLCV